MGQQATVERLAEGTAPAAPSPEAGRVSRPATPADQPSRYERYRFLVSTAVCGLALLLGWVLGRLDVIGGRVEVGFYIIAYLAGGTFATRKALTSLWRRAIDIDLLMVLAAVGAATIGYWVEGAILLFLFSLGNALQDYAMGRTYKAVRALMELAPQEALVLRDGVEARLPVEELAVGDLVLVKPGERIPADGEVARGDSAVDQAPITGESMPVHKQPGDAVFSGTINGSGLLIVRVTRLSHESTLARIITIVEQAQAEKSAAQRFTDRFEGYYAAGVIVAAALYGALNAMFGVDTEHAFYHAMILLVVASPCALIISTPATTLAALANGARHGILFKGAVHLENMGVVRAMAFDKTGTLTIGRPRLTDVRPLAEISADDLLALAASVERQSEHTLASAVVDAARLRELPLRDVSHLEAVTGRGVRATLDGQHVLIGNEGLLETYRVEVPEAAREVADALRDEGKTTMFVAAGTWRAPRVLGVLGVADTVRPVAPRAVARLRELGIVKAVMLTGDNERAARTIAHQAGIDEVRSGLLPEQKLEIIHDLAGAYGSVAMVGDGINDAPALATATIGVAMGAAGTDVALETADVVLIADDLTRLPYAVALSRKTRRVIRQNLTFALSVIAVLVTGTVLGITTLPLGVVGHEGSTIVVVLNGLRLLRGLDVPGMNGEGRLS
jgi:Cd2+/Zn2+-exporting ATPase